MKYMYKKEQSALQHVLAVDHHLQGTALKTSLI